MNLAIRNHSNFRHAGIGNLSAIVNCACACFIIVCFLIAAAYAYAQDNPDLNQLVDISTSHVKEHGTDSSNILKGRQILQESAQKLGYENWKSHTTLEIEAVDFWAKKGRWWPSEHQRFKAQYLLGTFTSQMKLTDGPWKDSILGVQSWQGYRRKDAKTPPVKSTDPLMLFYLPSLHYFNELPFRLLSAQFITYAGKKSHNGRTHDLIYATWGSLEANPHHDQFVLWIDRETSLVTMCHYTVRQAFPAAAGTIYYDSYQPVQGVTLPFKHHVLLEWPEEIRFPLEHNFFHRLEIQSAKFDSVAKGDLVPLTGLPEPRDWKPSNTISLNPN